MENKLSQGCSTTILKGTAARDSLCSCILQQEPHQTGYRNGSQGELTFLKASTTFLKGTAAQYLDKSG
jgi:hypothetical protein